MASLLVCFVAGAWTAELAESAPLAFGFASADSRDMLAVLADVDVLRTGVEGFLALFSAGFFGETGASGADLGCCSTSSG